MQSSARTLALPCLHADGLGGAGPHAGQAAVAGLVVHAKAVGVLDHVVPAQAVRRG